MLHNNAPACTRERKMADAKAGTRTGRMPPAPPSGTPPKFCNRRLCRFVHALGGALIDWGGGRTFK